MIPFSLWGDALWCGQEVVREAPHEQAIRGLFPIPSRREEQTWTPTRISSRNRTTGSTRADRGPGAEKVVGYLPKEDAHRYHPVLSELVAQGLQPQVPCQLSVSEWEPADWEGKGTGAPSSTQASRSPWASRTCWCRRTYHPPVATTCCRRAAGSWSRAARWTRTCWRRTSGRKASAGCTATMHAVEEDDRSRPARMVVEVRLDDEAVGRLSPRLSAEFLPAIHYLADIRAETAARMAVRGDR